MGMGTALHVAASLGRVAIVTELLTCGAEVDSRDESGQTPLHGAARYASLDTAQILLKAGADPDARTEKDMTPLHYAAQVGSLVMVKVRPVFALLLDRMAPKSTIMCAH